MVPALSNMCGIVGAAGARIASANLSLEAMRDAMLHRGPDDFGAFRSGDGSVVFGHRRLAIIDLTPGGHQPMSDHTGAVWITFNGEIYNYRELRHRLRTLGHTFRTESDTEVILEAYKAWGDDFLQHLDGMFALALYDSAERTLVLARDRAGEKPLFYRHDPGRLMFASELKALMAAPEFPRRLDSTALNFYLTYGYVPGELCILQGVHKLPAAHRIQYDVTLDRLQVSRYWSLPEPAAAWASDEELETELERLLRDSVKRQLVADVPVGVLLSGGIDSSLVTAMAAQVSSTVNTFTISFRGYGAYDEGPYARIVANHFGTRHTEIPAEIASVELLPHLARQYDEPIADSSMVPTFLVSRLIRQHAKVALGGDGGDELFGGYNHYSMLLNQQRARRFIPRAVRRAVGELAGRVLPVGLRGRNHLIGFTADLPSSIAHINVYFDHWTRRRLLRLRTADTENGWRPERYKEALCVPTHSLLRQATEVDFQTTMAEAYLVKVDRASMLNSLEVRAPWLDRQVVEFAFGSVPDRLRTTIRERKILPQRVAARLLPPTLDLRRKQGFSLPLAAWFKGKWGTYVEDVLSAATPDLFDAKVIRELIEGQHRGYSNTARLFALTLFELWRREYRVDL